MKDFKGVGKWNNARIVVYNGNVEHWLNHVKIVEFDRFSQSFQALVEKSKYKIWDNFGLWSEGLFSFKIMVTKFHLKILKSDIYKWAIQEGIS